MFSVAMIGAKIKIISESCKSFWTFIAMTVDECLENL